MSVKSWSPTDDGRQVPRPAARAVTPLGRRTPRPMEALAPSAPTSAAAGRYADLLGDLDPLFEAGRAGQNVTTGPQKWGYDCERGSEAGSVAGSVVNEESIHELKQDLDRMAREMKEKEDLLRLLSDGGGDT